MTHANHDQVAAEVEAGLITQPQTMPSALTQDIPEYMLKDLNSDRLDLMNDYLRVPRIAIVQGMSPPQAHELGPIGTIYLTPSYTPLFLPPSRDNPSPEPLIFTPVFMWPEGILWNPRGVQGLNAMRDRSVDRESEIFRRARSRNPKDREFICPEAPAPADGKPPKMCRYQEHLNFIVYLWNHAQSAIPMLLSFSRTGYKTGMNLIQTIKIRKIQSYGQLFQLTTADESNDEGQWKGFAYSSVIDPQTGKNAVVPEDWYEFYSMENSKQIARYENNLLEATYTEEDNGSRREDDTAAVEAAAARY